MAELVLITGISGFVGTAVALLFLENGWHVRGTVRSQDKADAWAAKYPQWKERVNYAVADLLEPGAFEKAVKGVTAIVHVATPFTFAVADVEKDMLLPAVEGTQAVLRAALGEPSVKAVSITSSGATVQNFAKFMAGAEAECHYDANSWCEVSYEAAKEANDITLAYFASKTCAEKGAYDFEKQENPHFAISSILPGFIFGPAYQPFKDKSEIKSPSVVWGLVDASTIPPAPVKYWVDVRDVAQAHYLAVTKQVKGRYILFAGRYDARDAIKAIKQAYPEHAGRLPVVQDEEPLPPTYTFDGQPAKELGVNFTPFDACIKDTLAPFFEHEKQKKSQTAA